MSTDEPHEIRGGLVIVGDGDESTTYPQQRVSITYTLHYEPRATITFMPNKPKENWRKGRPLK